jgi:nucleoside diphosphate kinase
MIYKSQLGAICYIFTNVTVFYVVHYQYPFYSPCVRFIMSKLLLCKIVYYSSEFVKHSRNMSSRSSHGSRDFNFLKGTDL